MSAHGIKVEASTSHAKSAASETLHELWEKACLETDVSEFERTILRKHLNRDVINTALLNLIITLNLSFRIVERTEFHLFCQALNLESRSFVPSAHSEVYAKLVDSFESEKDLVRKRLQSAISSLHISVDIWTTPNFYSCLAVCCSFVDRDEQRLAPLLALREVESHSGEDQWKALLPVLQDYGIVRKLGAVVGDNSTTNDTLCRAISLYLEEEENIQWDPDHQRICCQGHIINLAVDAFMFAGLWDGEELERLDLIDDIQLQLEAEQSPQSAAKANLELRKRGFRKMGALGQLHNIINHCRSSTSRSKQFETLVGRKIPLDNRTRWNSWWTMLDIALKHESGIDQNTKAYQDTLKEDFLQPQHWESLRQIKDFLEPFNSATLKLQGDHSTLGNVLLTMDVLILHMENSLKQPRLNKDLKHRIEHAWQKFDKYYKKTDTSPYYAAALILHPSWRTSYIKQVWKREWQRPALQGVKALWERFRDLRSDNINTTTGLDAHINIMDPKELNEFDRIERELKAKIIRPKSRDEYEEYCSGAPYEISCTPLQWWMQDQQRNLYPRLSIFAANILSIPAMSDELERVFSGGRRTMRWDRGRLSVDTLEKTECKKSWAKTGILKEIN